MKEKVGLFTGKKGYLKTAYYRNPDSLLDEFLIGLNFLLVVCIIITAGFGIYFHSTILDGAFGKGWIAVAGSFLLFLIAEVIKIWFGLNVARAIFTGHAWRSWQHLAFIAGVAVIVVFAYAWSIDISTKAVAEVNRQVNTTRVLTENETAPRNAEISFYDEQLRAADEAIAAAQKMTWKGAIVQRGQKIIDEQTQIKKRLLDERANLQQRSVAIADSTLLSKQAIVDKTASTLTRYGGYAEFATAIIILLIAILESIAYEQNKDLTGTTDKQELNNHYNEGGKYSPTPLSQRLNGLPLDGGSRVRVRGFQPETILKQHDGTVLKQRGNSTEETAKHLVPQAVSEKQSGFETALKQQTETTPTHTVETVVISADVANWKKYAATYWKRSRKAASTRETRERNFEKFKEYKSLLAAAGWMTIEKEDEGRLVFVFNK